jgi:hypothetical protein
MKIVKGIGMTFLVLIVAAVFFMSVQMNAEIERLRNQVSSLYKISENQMDINDGIKGMIEETRNLIDIEVDHIQYQIDQIK